MKYTFIVSHMGVALLGLQFGYLSRLCWRQVYDSDNPSLLSKASFRKTRQRSDSLSSTTPYVTLVDRDDFASVFPLGMPRDKSIHNHNAVLVLSFARPRHAVKSTFDHPKWTRNLVPSNTTNTITPQFLTSSAASLSRDCSIVKSVYNVVFNPYLSAYNARTCTALVPSRKQGQPFTTSTTSSLDTISPPLYTDTSDTLIHKFVATNNSSFRYESQYRFLFNAVFTFLVREPSIREAHESLADLQSYLSILPSVLDELRPVAHKVAFAKSGNETNTLVDNTIIVMVSNFGHSDMMINFFCAARQAKMSLHKILFFATDPETATLAQSMGVTAFYHPVVFASIPHDASTTYGDNRYSKIMMSKIFSAHLVTMLGHDFLFQDVDIIPYQSQYLEYFVQKATTENYDLFFQYDFNLRIEYTPWSINSGCYFVKNNPRTQNFFSSLLLMGDVILSIKSHQATVTLMLSRLGSRYGLRTKVLQEEHLLLPIGYHYLREKDFVRNFIKSNKTTALSMHYNWNTNKNVKRGFLEQMGDWYVQESCLNSTNISRFDIATCCAVEPLIRCHYRDTPSVVSCRSSPNYASNGQSFW